MRTHFLLFYTIAEDACLRRKVARYRALLRQGHRAEDIRVMLRLMEHLLRLGPSFAETARTAMRQVEVEETGMAF